MYTCCIRIGSPRSENGIEGYISWFPTMKRLKTYSSLGVEEKEELRPRPAYNADIDFRSKRTGCKCKGDDVTRRFSGSF